MWLSAVNLSAVVPEDLALSLFGQIPLILSMAGGHLRQRRYYLQKKGIYLAIECRHEGQFRLLGLVAKAVPWPPLE